jgi:hypothetical protein
MDELVLYDGKPVRKIEVEFIAQCKDGWPWVLRVHFFRGSSRFPGRYKTVTDALAKAGAVVQTEAEQKVVS